MAEDMDIPMPSMMPAGASSWRNARRRNGLDSSTGRLMLFAGVIGGGLLLLVGAWSLTGHRTGEVPVVEADSRPLRTKPENPGGLQLSGQDDAIMSGSSGGQDAMAPPPESPEPLALRQAPEIPAAPPTLPAVSSPPAEAPAVAASVPPAAAPTTEPGAAPAIAAAAPPPRAPLPDTAPVVRATTAPSPARLAPGPAVQLAALDSEPAARAEWDRLMARMPELLGGRSPVITRIARADGKVFFRLRTSGFPDIAQATAFCEKVRGKGAACRLAGA